MPESRMHADDPTAQDRLAQVADHLSGAKQAGKQALLQKHPDDVRMGAAGVYSATSMCTSWWQ